MAEYRTYEDFSFLGLPPCTAWVVAWAWSAEDVAHCVTAFDENG